MESILEAATTGRKRQADLDRDIVLDVGDVAEQEDHESDFEEDEQGEDDLNRKADKFFELMRRIHDIKKSWRPANVKKARGMEETASSTSRIDTPAPPPWTPRFCWEDFAPVGKASSQLAAAVAGSNSEDETGATLDRVIRRQTPAESVAGGNDDGQAAQMCRTFKVATVDYISNHEKWAVGTGTTANVQDCLGGGGQRRELLSSPSSPSGGSGGSCNDGTGAAGDFELKLAPW